MSHGDDRVNQIQAEIERLNNLKRGLRQREDSIKARSKYLAQPDQFAFNNVKQLRNELNANLAPHMVPANVGGINEVAWPFYFQVNFNFGANPTISTANILTSSFQVDQEAAFILMSLGRDHSTDAADLSATALAPLQLEIIDRQSSRRFNSGAIPLQMIGNNSNPSIFPTGMLVMPNAFLDFRVNGFNVVGQAITGSGAFQISCFGYRTRVENANKVLSTIFG